jgi:hypothetical protein
MENAVPALQGDPSHTLKKFTILWINEVTPGKVQEYIEKSKESLPFYERHGVDLLGCWIGGIGAKSNQIFFLFDYKDLDTYNRLYSDPEFIELHTRLDTQGMRSNTGWILNPIDMSPVEFKLTP